MPDWRSRFRRFSNGSVSALIVGGIALAVMLGIVVYLIDSLPDSAAPTRVDPPDVTVVVPTTPTTTRPIPLPVIEVPPTAGGSSTTTTQTTRPPTTNTTRPSPTTTAPTTTTTHPCLLGVLCLP